ncbi:MAG: efflux RND transporter periplasmic adaptor subunit, partial [Magnetovibrio sp.]|nr:efflux RND transporter periplasmic adaptor subunit [Magnetovibrio sp.]
MTKTGVLQRAVAGAWVVVALSLTPPAFAADYKTATVTVEQIGEMTTLAGTVVPYKEVNIAAQTPGIVTFISGAEGDDFTQDELLITIDDDSIQAQRRAALADIASAQAGMQNARVQYSRELISPRTNSVTGVPGMGMPTMFDQFFTRGFSNMVGNSNTGVERQADLYNSYSGMSQAQSQLAQAHARLETLDASLRDTRTVAPFDGVITQKLVEEGDTVQPGQALVRFAYTKYLRLQVEVPVRLVASLEKGMMLPARLDVRGPEVMARVAQIFPMADASGHTVTVKFDLPEGTPGGPGMYAEVRVPDLASANRSAPVVPTEALVWRGSFPSVFVIEGETISLRLVRLGVNLDDGRMSVLAGLKGGEQV